MLNIDIDTIPCAPPVLEPGWAQFYFQRLAPGETLAPDTFRPHVIWCQLEPLSTSYGYWSPCRRCGSSHEVHQSSSDWQIDTFHLPIPKGRISYVCFCNGNWIE